MLRLVRDALVRETKALGSSPREPSVIVSPGEQSQDRSRVILTPDQRVRVFISSTLEELAEERAAARRAIRRLHLVPVWYESGARPHPPQSMYLAYLNQSQILWGFIGNGMAGWGQEWRSRVWRMSSGWLLECRCCCI